MSTTELDPDKQENEEQPVISNADSNNCSADESDEHVELDKTEPPESSPQPDPVLSEIHNLLNQLAKDFETKLKYDAAKQNQIDKLYNENQTFKEGLLKKSRHLLILSVIEQIDDASKQIAHFDNVAFSEENYKKLLSSYREIVNDFQNVLLNKFDVVNYRCEPNSSFDPKRQRSLKTISTDDSNLHRLVVRSVRPGYETDDGFVLRPEMVEVYTFDQKQT
ncbi:MAG: hypothetical protein LBQ66_06465 [Planctomycetaceae bacterium]|jgi:molecular chaperone GrpE (heat shock protein)|nr:hypothetical protein [Planctomycetaceae bacterium]